MSKIRNTNFESINKLRNLSILDTEKEAEFESIAEIASYVCQTPISMVTFLEEDRQWFKAARGVGDRTEAPVSTSFCIHTINEHNGQLIANNLSSHPRFSTNPFVKNEPNFEFYAGTSITTSDGHRIGTVCVYDVKPRNLDEQQINCLQLLATYTMKLIELKASNKNLIEQKITLRLMNEDLKQYAYAIAHDIKAPLRVMSNFSTFLKKEAEQKMTARELEYLNYITSAAKELSNYTQNLLYFAENVEIDTTHAEQFDVLNLINSIGQLLNSQNKVTITYDKDTRFIFASKIGLTQILKNLISNSIRYRKNNIDDAFVKISMTESSDEYEFRVIDNGVGIPALQLKYIFHLFSRDKMNKESTGIGLNVVKRIVEKMNGKISVNSTEGIGTTVIFTLPKILKKPLF